MNTFWHDNANGDPVIAHDVPPNDLLQAMEAVWRKATGHEAPAFIYCGNYFYKRLMMPLLDRINRKSGRKSRKFNRRRLAHIARGNR